ncbi:hypothetical protein GCM10027294_53990 [Marinactinospora endophytica]
MPRSGVPRRALTTAELAELDSLTTESYGRPWRSYDDVGDPAAYVAVRRATASRDLPQTLHEPSRERMADFLRAIGELPPPQAGGGL